MRAVDLLRPSALWAGVLSTGLACVHAPPPAPPQVLEAVPLHGQLGVRHPTRWPKVLPCQSLEVITVGDAEPGAVWLTADAEHGIPLSSGLGATSGFRPHGHALTAFATPAPGGGETVWSVECPDEPGSVTWACAGSGCRVAAIYPLPAPHQPEATGCALPACRALADGKVPPLGEAERAALLEATRTAAVEAARWLAAACGRGQCAEPWAGAQIHLEEVVRSTWTFDGLEAQRVRALAGGTRVDLRLGRDAHLGDALTTALSVELSGGRLNWAVDGESGSASFDLLGAFLTLADGAVRLEGDQLVLGEPPAR